MVLDKDYDVLGTLGEGTFGKVFKAQHRRTGDQVAVKQIKLGSRSFDEACTSMELQALKALRHEFIVRLRELIRSQQDGSLYFVFEFLDSDLGQLIRRNPRGVEERLSMELARQLFAGLAHMHQMNFLHRDLKPENVLLDSSQKTIRIADMGQARSLRSRPPFTDYVGTRWYRAPECLLRDRSYSSPVDVWGAGLIFAELLRGTPLFCGTSSLDQLYKIFVVLGPPGKDWPEFLRLTSAIRFKTPGGAGCGLERVLPNVAPFLQAFIGEVLVSNPRRRPVARRCLEHSVFAQLPPLGAERPDSRTSMPGCDEDEALPPGPGTANPGAASSGEPPGREADASPVSAGLATAPAAAATVDLASTFDVDLDAELDKILGSPREAQAPAPCPALEQTCARPAVRTDVQEVPWQARSGFCFTPGARGPGSEALRLASERDEQAIDQRLADAEALLGRNRSLSPAREGLGSDRNAHEPGSPSCAVGALLESLCADFGLGDSPSSLGGDVPDFRPKSSAGPQLDEASPTRRGQAEDLEARRSPLPAVGLGASVSNSWDIASALPELSPRLAVPAARELRMEPIQEPVARKAPSPSLGLGASLTNSWDIGSTMPASAPQPVVAGPRDPTQEPGARIASAPARGLGASFSNSWDIGSSLPVSPPKPAVAARQDRLMDERGYPGLDGSGGAVASRGRAVSLPVAPDLIEVSEEELELPGLDASNGAVPTRCRSALAPMDPGQREAEEKDLERLGFDASRNAGASRSRAASAPRGPGLKEAREVEEEELELPLYDASRSAKASRRRAASAPRGPGLKEEGAFEADATDAVAFLGGSRHVLEPLATPKPKGKSWTAEESAMLRRVVKQVIRGGSREKEVLWAAVSAELGSGRAPKDCKQQYARDYRAHKARRAGEVALPRR